MAGGSSKRDTKKYAAKQEHLKTLGKGGHHASRSDSKDDLKPGPAELPQVFTEKEIDITHMTGQQFGQELDTWREELDVDHFLEIGKLRPREDDPRIIRLRLRNEDDRCAVFFRPDDLYGVGVETQAGEVYEVLYTGVANPNRQHIRNSHRMDYLQTCIFIQNTRGSQIALEI